MLQMDKRGISAQLKLSLFPFVWTKRDIKYLTNIGFHSTFLFLNNNFSPQLFRIFKVINRPIPYFRFDCMG